MNFSIDLDGGKYTVTFHDGQLSAERHNHPWRELTGDKLVLAMAYEIIRLRELSDKTPNIHIECEVRSDGIIGSTWLNVIRVEKNDDDSFTAVTDFWPNTEIAKLQAQNERIKKLFYYLDMEEESSSGRIFRPTTISSCRAVDSIELNKILTELKDNL